MNTKSRTSIFLLWLIGWLLPLAVASQKLPEIWAFDKYCGIRFEQDTTYAFVSPSFVYDEPSPNFTSYIMESFACITYDSLNYFYGGTERLFDRNGALVENGQMEDLEPCESGSEINGTALLPVPGSDSLFFWIIGQSACANYSQYGNPWIVTNENYGIKYSVVDASANNGLGRVLPDKKEIYLFNEQVSERMMCIRHANGRDWWVLGQRFPSGDFLIYKTQGDSLILDHEWGDPALNMLLESGPYIGVGEFDYDTVSHRLMYCTMQRNFFFFQFDPCDGTIFLLKHFDMNANPMVANDLTYGIAFSPLGNFGYLTCFTGYLYQFPIDLNLDTLTLTRIFEAFSISPLISTGELQRGVDGAIYFPCTLSGGASVPLPNSVGRITHADQPYPLCQIDGAYFRDSAWTVKIGLPNMPIDFAYKGMQPGVITASQDTGCAPLPIQFAHNSCGHLGQVWDFGDGSVPDSADRPTHVYGQVGDYQVSVVIFHEDLRDTLNYPISVRVQDCLGAGFTATPTQGCYELAVQFQPSIVGSASHYRWTFGDGGTDNAANPLHVYRHAGSYGVSLTVWNAESSDSILLQQLVVVEDCGEFLHFYPNPSDGHLSLDYFVRGREGFGLQVTDMLGQQLHYYALPFGYQAHELDMSRLAVGTYFATFTWPSGKVETRKFVVIR